jgi:hypothetical protein
MSSRTIQYTSRYERLGDLLRHLYTTIDTINVNTKLAIVYMISLENKLDNYVDSRLALVTALFVTKAKEALYENDISSAKNSIYAAISIIAATRQ